MEGYQREKNSQAILATNLTALHRHRNSLKEKKQMKTLLHEDFAALLHGYARLRS